MRVGMRKDYYILILKLVRNNNILLQKGMVQMDSTLFRSIFTAI